MIKNNSDQQEKEFKKYAFSVFHFCFFIIAIYLSFKCNNGFSFGGFLVACCCPYIYILFTLVTKGLCNDLNDD